MKLKNGGTRPGSKCLVIGGTGRCGQALVSELLDAGFSVRVLSRRPESNAALALRKSGVEVVEGNLFDPPSLEQALVSVDRACLITTPKYGYLEEISSGLRFLKAAEAASVDHLVFQSVVFADTFIPHCWSKGQIETALKDSGIPHTIIRPGVFLEVLDPLLEASQPRDFPIRQDVPIPWVAISNVGRSLARSLASGSGQGETFDLAHPNFATLNDLDGTLRRAGRSPLSFKFKPMRLDESVKKSLGHRRAEEFLAMYEEPEADYYEPLNEADYQCDPHPLMDRFGLTLIDPIDYVMTKSRE